MVSATKTNSRKFSEVTKEEAGGNKNAFKL